MYFHELGWHCHEHHEFHYAALFESLVGGSTLT
jgi:hypothetical protein